MTTKPRGVNSVHSNTRRKEEGKEMRSDESICFCCPISQTALNFIFCSPSFSVDFYLTIALCLFTSNKSTLVLILF